MLNNTAKGIVFAIIAFVAASGVAYAGFIDECDRNCAVKYMNAFYDSEATFDQCALKCGPRNYSCQAGCGEGLMNRWIEIDEQLRFCAAECNGNIHTLLQCYDKSGATFDACYNGCGSNQSCINACQSQYNQDIYYCDSYFERRQNFQDTQCVNDTEDDRWQCHLICDDYEYGEKYRCYTECDIYAGQSVMTCY